MAPAHRPGRSVLAYWLDGQQMPSSTYDLAGTPCYETRAGQLRVYHSNVWKLFPDDQNLNDKQCFMYGNVKPVFTADGDATVLRLEFGTGDGLYGGAWFPIKSAAGAEPCRGFGMTVKGGGAVPGRAFVVIRDSKGGSYRSKDIASLFGGTEWQDVVLTAEDFSIDSETKVDIAKTLPKQPDWTTMSRVDFSAVNLDASPVLELKSIDRCSL